MMCAEKIGRCGAALIHSQRKALVLKYADGGEEGGRGGFRSVSHSRTSPRTRTLRKDLRTQTTAVHSGTDSLRTAAACELLLRANCCRLQLTKGGTGNLFFFQHPSCCFVEEAMAKLFRAAIMGPPGSGKGTISRRIAQSFGLQYLSSGHFLRESIATNTEAGVLVKSYVERGLLVPDHVMTRLMLPRLEQSGHSSWLLDGFPRTYTQAVALNDLYQLDLVISLNIPYETLRERLSDRWVHQASGRVYNIGFNPPRVQGKDDVTGEPLIQHDDDKEEALRARLRHYKDVAKPVIDLYKSQGVLHSFSGTETDRIWPYINSLLSTKMHPQPSDSCQTQTP